MIKIEHVENYGWEAALRGMRNPLDSWDKADSEFDPYYAEDTKHPIGPNDLGLMRRLFKAGTEHRKYLRQIMVSMDVTAPLYWWKEFDTYKVGTTANSCSTMHRIHAKEFTISDFSCEHLTVNSTYVLKKTIDQLNTCRGYYNENHEKEWWYQMIQLLPTSYNQRRTITMNYEVAYRIIEQRSHHKLDEWHVMVEELLKLPYMKEIINDK